MYSKSPSRNHRSKSGIRLKHILQICLLVAVCFWLIYQVKRSHDKKKEFDEKDGRLAAETQTDGEMLRLGRKDVPRIIKTGTGDMLHGEDEEDSEVEEEDNKHEEDEIEREVSKTEGKEEEEEFRREGGDDEIDEHKQGKTDVETEHEEEQHEVEGEEKDNDVEGDGKEIEDEGEEKSEESKEGEKEEDHQDNEMESENQDTDGGDEVAHEAREEHYKADDASSEVAQEVVNMLLEHPNETLESKNSEQENVTQNVDQAVLKEKTAQAEEEEATEGLSSTNSTYIYELKNKDDLIKLEDSPEQNSTTLSEFKDQPQLENNSTTDKSQNSSVLPSEMQIPSNLTKAQDATVVGKPFDKHSNSHVEMLTQANTTILNKTEHANHTNGKSLSSSSEELKLPISENTINREDSYEGSRVNKNFENGGANESQVVKLKENGATNAEFESFDSHSENENVGSDQHDDPIDDSDSLLTQEETESRMDLGTFPVIRSEAQNTEEAEAE